MYRTTAFEDKTFPIQPMQPCIKIKKSKNFLYDRKQKIENTQLTIIIIIVEEGQDPAYKFGK